MQPELSKGSSLQYPSAHSIAAASRDNAAPAEASTHSEQQLVEPESFSNMQLMQMQQRQQQLLQHRLAVYQPSSVHAYQSGLQPQAAARKQQQLLPHIHSCSGALDVDMGVLDQPQGRAAPPDLLQSHGRTSPKSFQTFTEREPVADSPITLFSLGSPYSSSSPWGSTATAINSTTSPNEWAKLMAVKSMVGSVLVGKGSKAAPPSREGSADFTKGPLKGHASRPSSSMPLPNEATPKSASAAPKAGRRAVFSQEAIKMGSEGANDITRKLAGATTSSSSAAMQSSGEDTESVRSSAAEVGFAEEKVLTAGHESRSDADQQGMQQQALSVSAEADLDQGKLSAANRTESYAFNRSLSSVRPRRDSIPTASPLSRVVTYRPEMLRAAYQPPAVSDLSQSRVQDSMWEENPVAATLRYCGMTAEQREKQVEFAAQLGQWYKEQLQRRVPSRNTGVRTVTLVD